jgi:hypothetical protein
MICLNERHYPTDHLLTRLSADPRLHDYREPAECFGDERRDADMLRETDLTWARTRSDLRAIFRLWGVDEYDVHCAAGGAMAERRGLDQSDREVIVRFRHPDGREIMVRKSDWDRPVDNFRRIYFALDAMRKIWREELEDVVRAAYLQLDAPASTRDPYEVLGVRPDAPMEIVEVAYKTRAKTAHPDRGGSVEAMAELNAAVERIRSERGVAA